MAGERFKTKNKRKPGGGEDVQTNFNLTAQTHSNLEIKSTTMHFTAAGNFRRKQSVGFL